MIKNNLKMSEEMEAMASQVAEQLQTSNGSIAMDAEEEEDELSPLKKLFSNNIDPKLLEQVISSG